jgi:hypothetical protein
MSRELEGLSLLNYQREENDEHGGKEPRSAQVGDWMPILTIQPKFDALVLGSLGLSIARWPTSRMHSRNRLANGMRPPSVAQYDILSANIAISIRAPSSIVERPSPRSAGPLPHRSEHTPHPRLPQAISPVASSPQSVHSRAKLLPARKTHRFFDYHAGGGSAPNPSGPFQHSINPATPLKHDTRLGSPPKHLSSIGQRPASARHVSHLVPSMRR